MQVLSLVVLSWTVVNAIPENQNRIVGGSITSVNQYPTIASLLYSYFGTASFNQACGGTIITTRAVLTAAHCPSGDAPTKWRVRVGSSYANNGGIVHSLISITLHPEYDARAIDNDVAILRTVNSITYNNVVQPAYIAGTGYYLSDNEVVWAAGWGTTQSGGSASEQLRHVQLWTVNQDTCRLQYSDLRKSITANMLCSGWLNVGGRDQCQGDSGGPLYHNGVVVGICSWGAGCASARYPGVNTRVSRFTTWIQANA